MLSKIISDFLEANVFIIEKNDNVLLVDCGADVQMVKDVVKDKKVVGILLTHGHYDHAANCLAYSKIFNCPIYADSHIAQTLSDPEANYSPNGEKILDYTNFILLEDDGNLKIENFEIAYFYCPGHSICSKIYLIDKQLYAGDVLFEKSFGRTDLKYSDSKQMLNSLVKIENLDYETLYSGHGNSSDKQTQQKNIAVFKKYLTRF